MIIPLLIFPALFIALPLLLQSEAAELDALKLDVIWQGDVNETLDMMLSETNILFTYEEMPDMINNLSDIGNDIDRIRNQDVDAVFRLSENGTNSKVCHTLSFN